MIGTQAGTKPPAEAAEKYAKLLPPQLGQDSYAKWSYTQWEILFALHHKRPLIGFAPDGAFPRGPIATGAARWRLPALFRRAPSIDPSQAELLAYLKSHNLDLTKTPANISEFIIESLRALLPPGGATGGEQPIHPELHSIGELFTGRDGFLADIHTSLTQKPGAMTAISAVRGLGGIGKTRAAIEYALRHRDHYTALLFARASDNPDTAETNLADLTGVLRLPTAPTAAPKERLDAVLDWMTEHHGWLLILDNADTPAALRNAMSHLRALRNGHILITSRLSPAEFPQDIEPLGLGLLTPEDAKTYLLKATERFRRSEPNPDEQAEKLAAALDHLTLALVHAAAYINERQFTFARYFAAWESHHAAVLDWARDSVTGYPASLTQTWLTSVKELTPEARALLERLSFFANAPVPESLLEVPIQGAEKPQGLAPLLVLKRFSLASGDETSETFTIHRIVRDVANRRLATDPDAYRLRLTESMSWLNAAFVGHAQDAFNWPRLDPIAPHAETLAETVDKAGIADPTSRLMSALETLFDAKAQHARAEPLSRRALAIAETSLGPDHPEVAAHLNNLATLLQATNRLAEAEPLTRTARTPSLTSAPSSPPWAATRRKPSPPSPPPAATPASPESRARHPTKNSRAPSGQPPWPSVLKTFLPSPGTQPPTRPRPNTPTAQAPPKTH